MKANKAVYQTDIILLLANDPTKQSMVDDKIVAEITRADVLSVIQDNVNLLELQRNAKWSLETDEREFGSNIYKPSEPSRTTVTTLLTKHAIEVNYSKNTVMLIADKGTDFTSLITTSVRSLITEDERSRQEVEIAGLKKCSIAEATLYNMLFKAVSPMNAIIANVSRRCGHPVLRRLAVDHMRPISVFKEDAIDPRNLMMMLASENSHKSDNVESIDDYLNADVEERMMYLDETIFSSIGTMSSRRERFAAVFTIEEKIELSTLIAKVRAIYDAIESL